MNIVDVIRGETSNYLDKSAIIDGNNQISYAELFAAIDGLAAELKACGIRPAQRVALLCGDSIDYIVINLAVLSISAVIVPVFPSSSRDEINTIIEKMSINYLISERPIHFQDNTKQILFNYTGKKEFFLYHRLLGEQISAEYYTINPAFIRFSSGTTGINKGVVLSHESIIQRTDAANKGLKITSEDIIIWILSMTFHFVVTIFLFLRRAATIVLCSSEFPQALIDGLKRCKATFIYASPFHYYMLSHTDVFRPDLLSGVRIAVSTATNLPNDNAGDFYEKFGFELSQAYGIIEVGLPFINCSADKTKRGSVGRILPDYEIKIVNPDAEGIG
ncbi:MAG: long-chain fatty acid--CoA ligase, partial [Candidatus Omnitrophica bacterium]|nr:long-chain fatty acid--CoA ligase [Candidatus Omnitrophota bacterium]